MRSTNLSTTLWRTQDVDSIYPLLTLIVGLAVLGLGRRLPILGGAVGFLLGLVLVDAFTALSGQWMSIIVPIALTVAGFFGGRLAVRFKGLVALTIGAIGGALVFLSILDRLELTYGIADWLLAILVGFLVGLLARRFEDWVMVGLASVIGGLLVIRGLSAWFDIFDGTFGTLAALAIAGGGVWFQGRSLQAPAEAKKEVPPPAASAPVATSVPPAVPMVPPPAPTPPAELPPTTPPAVG